MNNIVPRPSIRELLYLGIPIDIKLIEFVAEANSVDINKLTQFVGMNINNFHSKVVCGGYLFSKSNSSGESIDIEAPLAFQSALAGILLASELIISKLELRNTKFKNHTQLYPLNRIKKDENPYNSTMKKDTRCICNDDDFKKVYENKWDESHA